LYLTNVGYKYSVPIKSGDGAKEAKIVSLKVMVLMKEVGIGY
jgi:hypothetical protein